MQESDNNTIVFYKAQGTTSEEFSQLKEDDFVLILMNDTQHEMLENFRDKSVCMDSTHGLNSYGFELTTLLVLDELNQGFQDSKKRGKKRPLQKSKWIKEVSKRLRNSGKQYASASKSKKKFNQRKMFPPCTLKCRLQCSSKFNEEERTRIFEKYWG